MRTIKLSHAEIETLQRALGIAEMQMSELRQNYLKTVVNVRGVTQLELTRKEADGMFNLENDFCDLLIKIKKGEADI
jgi:1,2-phenylacetyl-CoA epoxidase catalytic subunit